MNEPGLIDAIHAYWFGPLRGGIPEHPRNRLWFGGDPAVDAQIRERFGAAVAWAKEERDEEESGFGAWEASDRGALALILLLDQFPRHIYRGRPEAFAGDRRARAVVRRLLDAGRDQRLEVVERCFLYLPLEHSEALADHERCVALFDALLREYRETRAGHQRAGEDFLRSSLEHARRHREIIARFGRYPHRNVVLGRASTPAESAWLEEGGARFGQ